jgi:ketosteroid isomerase-like protein
MFLFVIDQSGSMGDPFAGIGTGRSKGKLRATGRLLNAQVAHVWDFRDGKVIRCSNTRTPGSSLK